MVKAVVGANWGDEGKGKITDMLAEQADIIVDSREARMQVIQLSMIMESLHYTHFHQEYFTIIRQVLSETV